jgi:hypothetical protein
MNNPERLDYFFGKTRGESPTVFRSIFLNPVMWLKGTQIVRLRGHKMVEINLRWEIYSFIRHAATRLLLKFDFTRDEPG